VEEGVESPRSGTAPSLPWERCQNFPEPHLVCQNKTEPLSELPFSSGVDAARIVSEGSGRAWNGELHSLYRYCLCATSLVCREGVASKRSGVCVVSQRLIPTGERSGLLTHIAVTESVSLCVRMKTDGIRGTRLGDSRALGFWKSDNFRFEFSFSFGLSHEFQDAFVNKVLNGRASLIC